MNYKDSASTFLKRFSYGERTHPTRDWLNLVALSAALIALSVAWNLWLFAKVERGEVFGENVAPTAFDAAPVETIRAVFKEREAEELRYKREYRFVDPSI